MPHKKTIKPTPERLLSIADFAERLSMSPWTIRLWIEQGKLQSAKFGKGQRNIIRIPESEFNRLLAENLRPATRSFQRKSA